MRRSRFTKPAISSLACGAMLFATSSLAVGQQPDRNERRSSFQPAPQQNEQEDSASQTRANELPKSLAKLDLSSEQQQRIRSSIQEQNQRLQQTWQKFNQRHAEAVEMEAAWLAAVRDTLSDAEKKSFDQKAKSGRSSQSDSAAYHGSASPTSASQRGSSGRDSLDQRTTAQQGAANRQNSLSTDSQNQRSADTKATDAENANQNDSRNSATNREPGSSRSIASTGQADANSRSTRGQQNDGQQSFDQNSPNAEVLVITFVSPDQYLEGLNQTPEQSRRCSEACREYRQELSAIWQDMHRLHNEMVQIEAEKFSQIESQLTDGQLEKLRGDRAKPDQMASRAKSHQ